jgi:CRP/FNR family transcriptional regulator
MIAGTVALRSVTPVTVGRRPVLRTVAEVPKQGCSTCCLKDVCLPSGVDAQVVRMLEGVVRVRRKLERGAPLYRAGERFESLYAVRSGAFKSVALTINGDEKVTGFFLPGEIMGLEGIASGLNPHSAVALEDSEVCVIPFQPLEALTRDSADLQRRLFRMLSLGMARDQGLMLMLGGMTAEQRVAGFLLSVSRRSEMLGFSATRFVLRMSREEIGSYLGLSLETVSRVFSRLQREGAIHAHLRDVEFLDPARVSELAGLR